MSGENTFESAADALEAVVMRSCRAAGAHPPAVKIRRAAVAAAPEFVKAWESGEQPLVTLDVVKGEYVIHVTTERAAPDGPPDMGGHDG